MQPFTCPHCGSHAYTVVLTRCSVSNATLEQTFEWDEKEQQYTSSGTIVAEAQEIEPQDSQAICFSCEQDVTEAVGEYEASLSSPGEAAGA